MLDFFGSGSCEFLKAVRVPVFRPNYTVNLRHLGQHRSPNRDIPVTSDRIFSQIQLSTGAGKWVVMPSCLILWLQGLGGARAQRMVSR